MRLKQLLGILLPLLALSLSAAAAVSQLTAVDVASQGGLTTVTIRANGPFTHTEYRPAEGLLLVDLAGVSAAQMDGKAESVKAAGVTGYRVQSYQGAGGAEVTRIELALASSPQVSFTEGEGELRVLLASGGAAQPAAAPAAEPAASAATATIQKVSVAKAKGGVDVHVDATAPLSATTMRLSNPERLVIDLANAVPARKKQQIPVRDANVKAVRMAAYQVAPPVTRLVVDLERAADYEVVNRGNGLTVQVRDAAQPASAPARQEAPVTVAATQPAAPAPQEPATVAQVPAQELVVVQPEYHEKDPAKAAADRNEQAIARYKAEDATANAAAPAPAKASLRPEPAVNLALMQQQQQQAAAQAAVRPRYTGEPISVNLKDVDLKDFFRLIHEISGLNIVLDPNVKGTLTIVLDEVPWDQALDIVLKNNGLDRELEGNVLRIATVDTLRKESEARRAQIEAKALAAEKLTRTHFLSYAHARDVVPTIKRFLSSRGEVIADERTNALIIQDIPSVFPEVDRLLGQLDRKTQEVEIEARVVAATRNFARDIGMQLGFGSGLDSKVTSIGGAVGSTAGRSPIEVDYGDNPPPYVIGDGGTIPLFSNFPVLNPSSGLHLINLTNNYRIDAILTMAESRGLLKILSRPRVVTQNNIQAIVRQGVRVPVVTQAQLGGPPTVTYVDAFLRLTVTPQITVENTIFLNVDVENTTPDFSRTVQNNPTLITQQATTQVLVTDGGTVVIGGVIQTQNSVNVFQVPLLGDIPILGNLFKRRSVSTSTQELIFFITPRIIQT
jgi:type IV pilus assembly protein PilQ